MKLPASFLAKVTKSSTCWLWQGARNVDGYGRFGKWLAHRYSYAAACGSIPIARCVLHRCDTPACVNPAHLFLGTQNDNMKDMALKGRSKKGRANPFAPQGEQHGMARLKADEVLEIRRLISMGVTQRRLAQMYRVSFQHVSDIQNRKRWAHI